MSDKRLIVFKLPCLIGIAALVCASPARAASSITYPGSQYFTATPTDWVVNVKVDEVSGIVQSLVEVYKDGNDATGGLLQGLAEIGPLTTPNSRIAQRSPVDTDTAVGRARVVDTLENIGDASGVFDGGLGERLRITSTSNLEFDLEYDGPLSSTDSEAVICLMPIQLAVIRGDAVASGQEAKATYSYSLEVDGEEIYTSSMSLTESGGSLSLTALDGDLRTDGVFFEDPTYDTFGFNFPSLTLNLPMGIFANSVSKEAVLSFTTVVEAADNGWGGYSGPSSPSADPNMFIPVAMPEPQVAAFLAVGLLGVLLRRSRS